MNDTAPALSLRRLAWSLVAATYVLLVFGSSVRVHGAGLACPDWPLCFGMVLPPIDFHVGLEFGHRVLAGLVSLGFVGLAVSVFRTPALRALRPLTLFAAVVLATQVVLGGLTVLELLAQWTVASHLVAGNTFCLLLLVHALYITEQGQQPVVPATVTQRVAAVGMGVVLLAQLVLGGLVAASFAGLACNTWPGCNGAAWFPTFQGLIGLQVMHRIAAYTVGGAALAAFALNRGDSPGNRASVLLLVLVGLQITLGVANVLLRMPVEVSILHSAGADAIVLATAWLNYRVWRAPLAHAVPERAPVSLRQAEAA